LKIRITLASKEEFSVLWEGLAKYCFATWIAQMLHIMLRKFPVNRRNKLIFLDF
jgi:hypothetical protein